MSKKKDSQGKKERSASIPYEILSHPDLSPTDKLVYAALERYGFKTGECFPSHSLLAKDIAKSRRTVIKSLNRLVEKKVIERQFREGRVCYYWLKAGQFSENQDGEPVQDAAQVAETEPVQHPAQGCAENDTTPCAASCTQKPLKEALKEAGVPRTNLIGEASNVQSGNGSSGGLVSKDSKKEERLSELEREYIYNQSEQHQTEIFDAIDRWEKCFPKVDFPDLERPKASKLDEWLFTIRDKDSDWKGDDVVDHFGDALEIAKKEHRKEEKPVKDVIGWLIAGFRQGYIWEYLARQLERPA